MKVTLVCALLAVCTAAPQRKVGHSSGISYRSFTGNQQSVKRTPGAPEDYLDELKRLLFSLDANILDKRQGDSSFQCVPLYFNTAQGFISAGGEGVEYQPRTDYCFLIDATGDISVTWSDRFYIEAHDTCMYDYLELTPGYSTATGNGDASSKYCGGNSPPVTSLTGPVLATFHTDESGGGQGFNMSWSAPGAAGSSVSVASNAEFDAAVGCPMWDTAQGNTISLADYGNDVDVCYTIPGNAVSLTFESMDVEYDENCVYDYIELIDRNANWQRVCGDVLPAPMILDGPIVFHFSSDYARTFSGYSISFTSS